MAEDATTGRARALRLKRMAKEWEGYVGKPAPSGWCLDQLHDKCRHKFIYGTCNCKCHDPKPEPKKRGRPRKDASN